MVRRRSRVQIPIVAPTTMRKTLKLIIIAIVFACLGLAIIGSAVHFKLTGILLVIVIGIGLLSLYLALMMILSFISGKYKRIETNSVITLIIEALFNK